MSVKSLCLVLLMFAFTSAGEITFRDCGSARVVEKVLVSNCDVNKCDVVRGQQYDIEVHFISGTRGVTLDIDLRGKATIITVPILITTNGEGCDGLNIGCPFPGGARLIHQTSVVVDEQFFESEAVIIHKLIDNLGNTQVCIETDVTIVAPPTK